MINPKVFIIDVDGVLTDGKMYYTAEGKYMKAFSVDDHDALKMLMPHIEIIVISGDKAGREIAMKRVYDDMNLPFFIRGVTERLDWIKSEFNPKEVVYMGDGIFDNKVFEEVGYAITVNNAFDHVKESADYITKRNGGDRAVAESCLHLLERFFSE